MLVPLVLRRLEAAEVGPATEQTAGALSEAEVSTRSARLAYIAGGLVYVAITSLTLTLGMSATLRLSSTYVKLILVYFAQWPSLIILVWFVGVSLRARLTIIGGYLLLGLLLLLGVLVVPIAPSFSRAATAVGYISLIFVLLPIGGVLLLLARPLRPWLIGIVAILLFVTTGVATGFLIGTDKVNNILGIDKFDTSKLDAWWFVEAAILPVVAVVLAWWVLRRRSWPLPVAVIVFLATAAALWASPLLPDYWKVGPFWLGPLLGVPANILQVLIVWLVFKLIVRLQERQFLPAQVLHSHLCWGFLTIYLLIVTALTGGIYQWWTPWAVLLAFALYLFVLHVLLRRIWVARVGCLGKRLLLLRVFGKADKRERLLDALDDTWRRVGRIDLIGGADLATRTMGSVMLEAFLLRRTDELFLKTNEDVDRRLEHLHSQLEGDARYPVNGIYCYATAWQQAVAHVAPKSDAVLMDLRGFTRKNHGCVFELTWVIQQIPLSRIILLIDATSDYQALEEVAQSAWAHLRSDSPNAGYVDPVLMTLNAPRRPKDMGRALFMLLLRATYYVKV
jgi:hypothetical protein